MGLLDIGHGTGPVVARGGWRVNRTASPAIKPAASNVPSRTMMDEAVGSEFPATGVGT